MLKKTRSGGDKVKVTFVLPPHPHADHVHVVGEFNHWQASTPMKRDKEGRWRATVELEPGKDYQFRYLVDGNHWVNDEAADRYVPGPFGADNCVLTTPEASVKGTARRTGGNATSAKRSQARGKKAGESASGKASSNGAAGQKRPGGSTASRGRSSGNRSPEKGS